jgi:DNA-binding LacI/PurR family transcriptional regulator
MEDVAARAGVSRALVSIVFRDLPGASQQTRERVRGAAADLGYRMDNRARLLSRKHTRLIGVSFGVGHEFHADLITELYAAARESDYELVLSGVTRGRNEHQAAQDLLAFRCDALVLLGPAARPTELSALARQVPTIVVARATDADGVDVVRTDDAAGEALATQRLIELGHIGIAHVDGGRAPGAAERRRGYRSAMSAAGLADAITVLPGGLTDADGSRAAERFLTLPMRGRPSAVTVFNDQSAIGFLATVRAAGTDVPGAVSIIGYDDSRLARSRWAQLTTVAQNTPTIARSAVGRAIARISGEPPGPAVLVPPALVERATTAEGAALRRRRARSGAAAAARSTRGS